MIWLALMACAEPVTSIQVSGQVLSGQDSVTGAPDVLVLVRDGNTNEYSEATTDEDGVFKVEVPASTMFHLELASPEGISTAFSVLSGSADFDIPAGYLWIRSPLELDALRMDFENCDSVGEDGGIIEGTIHFTAVHTSSGLNLVAEEATALIYESDGITHEVCYLDDDGVSDPAAEQVGATGRFAAFGIPAGPISVQFTYAIDTLTIQNWGNVYLPENGVGPFYPALIDLP